VNIAPNIQTARADGTKRERPALTGLLGDVAPGVSAGFVYDVMDSTDEIGLSSDASDISIVNE
jgi:hypothetical protein